MNELSISEYPWKTTDAKKLLDMVKQGNHSRPWCSGSIAGGLMICVSHWSFGIDLDFYTTGISGRIGLGPRMLRWYWTTTRGKDGERLGYLKWECDND